MSRSWRHLILFDGQCGLCSRAVQFVLAHDRAKVFGFAPLESELGRRTLVAAGRTAGPNGTFILVEDYGTTRERVLIRSRAALSVAGKLGWPWSMSRAFGVLPAGLSDRMYDVVAANRYRFFGRRDQCFLPKSEDRDRFVGSSAP